MLKRCSLSNALAGAALILGLGVLASPATAQSKPADTSHTMQGMDHGKMHMQASDSVQMTRMMRMMENPAMLRQMMADTAMHRRMMEMVAHMPKQQRERMMKLMKEAKKDPAKPAGMPGMDHSKMPGMQKH